MQMSVYQRGAGRTTSGIVVEAPQPMVVGASQCPTRAASAPRAQGTKHLALLREPLNKPSTQNALYTHLRQTESRPCSQKQYDDDYIIG